MIYKIALLLATAAGIQAACDNQCSGHGSCMVDDVCQCHDNWGSGLSLDSGDCSDRVCPFEVSWVDEPNQESNFHKYSECSGKGVCNRGNGLCECFEGFEGKACQRSACPNDCSGHGTCEYIEDVPFGVVWNQYDGNDLKIYSKTKDYYSWDKTKTRACVCDSQFTDVDCSKRMCPHGNDVIDLRTDVTLLTSLTHQTQLIKFFDESGATYTDHSDKTFALQFTSRLNETFATIPIKFDYGDGSIDDLFADDVKLALLSLPNQIIDDCTVVASRETTGGNHLLLKVTFSGAAVQGRQNLLEVLNDECLDGCTPKVTGLLLSTFTEDTDPISTVSEDPTGVSHLNSFECGRRGKCDYESGMCSCFEGYTGENCNTQTTLV